MDVSEKTWFSFQERDASTHYKKAMMVDPSVSIYWGCTPLLKYDSLNIL